MITEHQNEIQHRCVARYRVDWWVDFDNFQMTQQLKNSTIEQLVQCKRKPLADLFVCQAVGIAPLFTSSVASASTVIYIQTIGAIFRT